jgi:hypothetical protein
MTIQKRLSPPYVCDTRLLYENNHKLTWYFGLLYSQLRAFLFFAPPNALPLVHVPVYFVQIKSESHVA